MTIQLPGTANFRSLKGLPTTDGRRLADHTVLRSDQLHLLGEDDWAVLRALGLKTVIDLRGENERKRYPNRLPLEGVQQLPMEVISDVRADPHMAAMLAAKPDAEGALDMMTEIYRRLPLSMAQHLPRLFGLFESGEVPVLIHCAAGKDRTGFAVAVLLHALGVSRDEIYADYLLSTHSTLRTDPTKRAQLARMVFELIGQEGSSAMIDSILDVKEVYLDTAFNAVDEHYGSMDAYLHTTAGLDTAALQRLRAQWLTAA